MTLTRFAHQVSKFCLPTLWAPVCEQTRKTLPAAKAAGSIPQMGTKKDTQGRAKLAGKSRITLLYLIRSKQIINADRFLQKTVGVYYSIIWYLLIILVFDFTLKFNKSEQRP